MFPGIKQLIPKFHHNDRKQQNKCDGNHHATTSLVSVSGCREVTRMEITPPPVLAPETTSLVMPAYEPMTKH